MVRYSNYFLKIIKIGHILFYLNFRLILVLKIWKFNTITDVFFVIYTYKNFEIRCLLNLHSYFKFFDDKLYIILLHRSSAQNRFLSNATIAFKFNTILNTILSEDRRVDWQISTTADLLHTADQPYFTFCAGRGMYCFYNDVYFIKFF